MDYEKEIKGICPLCKDSTDFRELKLSENLLALGGFVGEFLSGGLAAKANNTFSAINDFSDSRKFPNYKCGSCGGMVMKCSKCEQIIPYAHYGSSHFCGVNNSDTKVTNQFEDDVISKLERLGSLRERGLLTENEFEQQKIKLLG